MLRSVSNNPMETDVLRALASYSSDLLVLVRPDGTTQGQLTLGAVPLGYPPEQRHADRHVAEHVHPDDLAGVLALLEQVRERPGSEATIKVRARHYDGSWRMLTVDVIDRTDDPVLGGIVLRVSRDDDADGDERTSSDAGGSDGSDNFRSLAEVVPLGILSADRRGFVVYVNHEATRLLSLPADQLYGDGWETVVEAEDRPEVASAAGAVLRHSERERITFRATVRGEIRWFQGVFVPLGPVAHRTGWTATFDDVTDRRSAEKHLAHQATHDALTGLPNRALLFDRLGQAIARLQRDTQPLSLLFIDLDDFKPVNDRLGHAVGDEVLIEVARRLRSTTRAVDTVGRFGGDEFVVICESMDERQTREFADRITEALAEPFVIAGTTIHLGASIGAVITNSATETPAELLAEADRTMYQAKHAGGGSLALSG